MILYTVTEISPDHGTTPWATAYTTIRLAKDAIDARCRQLAASPDAVAQWGPEGQRNYGHCDAAHIYYELVEVQVAA